MPPGRGLLAYVSLAQGLYFFVSGIWPLLSIRTFELVTGPKADRWLVKTVGALVAVIGAVLAVAGWRREAALAQPEVPLLAVGSAAALTGVDVFYAATGRISKVYLLDAAVEVALMAAWAAGLRRHAPAR